jgi:hypothetical protein
VEIALQGLSPSLTSIPVEDSTKWFLFPCADGVLAMTSHTLGEYVTARVLELIRVCWEKYSPDAVLNSAAPSRLKHPYDLGFFL